MIMFCPKCGNELPIGAAFCPNCGAEQAAEIKKTADFSGAKNFLQGKKKKLLIAGAAAVGAVILLIILSRTVFRPFAIEGKWKITHAEYLDVGSIVIFNGTSCDLYGYPDTYVFYRDGGDYRLDLTGFMGSGNLSFDVTVDGKDHIYLDDDGYVIELTRIE